MIHHRLSLHVMQSEEYFQINVMHLHFYALVHEFTYLLTLKKKNIFLNRQHFKMFKRGYDLSPEGFVENSVTSKP